MTAGALVVLREHENAMHGELYSPIIVYVRISVQQFSLFFFFPISGCTVDGLGRYGGVFESLLHLTLCDGRGAHTRDECAADSPAIRSTCS